MVAGAAGREAREGLRTFLVIGSGFAGANAISILARFQADRHRQGRRHAHIVGMDGIEGAGELAGGEAAVIEVGRRGVGIDEQRAVTRVPGVDLVDILAVADIGIHAQPTTLNFMPVLYW